MYLEIKAIDKYNYRSKGKTHWAWSSHAKYSVDTGDSVHNEKLIAIRGEDVYERGYTQEIQKSFTIHLTAKEICAIVKLAAREKMVEFNVTLSPETTKKRK